MRKRKRGKERGRERDTGEGAGTVWCQEVDGMLLVSRAGHTRRDYGIRANDLLTQANVRVLGGMLTNAPRDTAVGDYYS